MSENATQITELPQGGIFSLRCRNAAKPALETALGLALPASIGGTAEAGTRRALCLGPDEWTIFCDGADRAAITKACAEMYEDHPHSLTDISFREIGIQIEGPDALTLLTNGCPRDLSRLAVGQGARTVFDTAQVVILRPAAEVFHLYAWRSFFPHVRGFLSAGETELALGL